MGRQVQAHGAAVVVPLPPLVALPQHQGHQHVGVVSLPPRQQILEPLVVAAVGHAVADHEEEGVLLQGEAGGGGHGGGVLEPGGEGGAGEAADRPLALDVGGGRAVLVEHRLPALEVRLQQVDGGEAPLLVPPEVQRGVHRPQGGARLNAGGEELLHQPQGHLALPLGLPAAAHAVGQEEEELPLAAPEVGQAVPAHPLALLGGGAQGHVVGHLPPLPGGGLLGGHGLGHQLPQLDVLPPGPLALGVQLPAVLPPQQQGGDLGADSGEELGEVDAAVGEVGGEVLRLRPAPGQEGGGSVVEGVEGGDILLVPAQVPEGAAPADHLRGSVKDHGGVLLLLGGRSAEALVEGAEGLGAEAEALAEAVALPGSPAAGHGRLPQQQGAVVAEEPRQDRAGQQPQDALPGQAHLQGVGQLHRQGGPGGGEGAEQGVLEPDGVPKGGEDGLDEHQHPRRPEGRAEIQKNKAPRHAPGQRGQGLTARPQGGQEPRRQRGPPLQAAAGGEKSRQSVPRQPDDPPVPQPVQGDAADLHSLSPSHR